NVAHDIYKWRGEGLCSPNNLYRRVGCCSEERHEAEQEAGDRVSANPSVIPIVDVLGNTITCGPIVPGHAYRVTSERKIGIIKVDIQRTACRTTGPKDHFGGAPVVLSLATRPSTHSV